jgi:hypothetical protein
VGAPELTRRQDRTDGVENSDEHSDRQR